MLIQYKKLRAFVISLLTVFFHVLFILSAISLKLTCSNNQKSVFKFVDLHGCFLYNWGYNEIVNAKDKNNTPWGSRNYCT